MIHLLDALQAVLKSTYTPCISATTSCASAARLGAAIQYRLALSPKRALRIRASRDYAQSSDDDGGDTLDAVPAQAYEAAADTLDVRLRFFDAQGYIRHAPRIGYTYQYAQGNAPAYHSPYALENWYFGRGIHRGSDGPARDFNIVLKVLEKNYAVNQTPAQSLVSLNPNYMIPLDESGIWRIQVGATWQQRFAGATGFAPESWSVEAIVTHDLTSWAKAYMRIESTTSTGSRAVSPANQRSLAISLTAQATL